MYRLIIMKLLFGTILLCTMLVGACSSSDAAEGDNVGGEVSFGAEDEQCASAKLANELDDPQILEMATKCFFAEMDAGNPVVIDIVQPTVEGDNMYLRYDFDGSSVLLVQDSRLDTFGRGVVDAQRCATVEPTNSLPEGVDCEPIDHAGFVQAS